MHSDFHLAFLLLDVLGSELIGGLGCSTAQLAMLDHVQVFGLASPPSTITLNGTVVPGESIAWDQTNKVISLFYD